MRKKRLRQSYNSSISAVATQLPAITSPWNMGQLQSSVQSSTQTRNPLTQSLDPAVSNSCDQSQMIVSQIGKQKYKFELSGVSDKSIKININPLCSNSRVDSKLHQLVGKSIRTTRARNTLNVSISKLPQDEVNLFAQTSLYGASEMKNTMTDKLLSTGVEAEDICKYET